MIQWVGCSPIFHFTVEGSYVDRIIMLAADSLSLISLGLVVASRVTSEEFAEGVLNFITWPMMFVRNQLMDIKNSSTHPSNEYTADPWATRWPPLDHPFVGTLGKTA